MDNEKTTKKMAAVQSDMNEQQLAEKRYSDAWNDLFADPTNQEKIKAFEEANAALWNTRDAYRIARKLLLQRHEELRRAAIDAQIQDSLRSRLVRDGNRIRFAKPH